ncbi:MAG: PilZ domain-containing protein [Planctomycetota bacterium]
MATPRNVAVTVPSLVGTSTGTVSDVWHAIDGVRVQVQFPLENAPLLPVGRAGELAFFRADIGQSVAALGKVAHRNDCRQERTYHFLFGDRTRQSLATLLEPRRAQRVYPEPDEPVEVTIAIPGTHKAIIGVARDVSTSGLGIDIPWENEAALSQHETIHVQVRLPNDDLRIEFDTRVRNRSLGQGAIIYGLEFCLEEIEADDPGILAVHQYVVKREADAANARRLEKSA